MLPYMRVVLLALLALSACGQDPEPCAWQDIETNLEYGEASFPDGSIRASPPSLYFWFEGLGVVDQTVDPGEQIQLRFDAPVRAVELEPLVEVGRQHAAGLRVGDRMPVELTVRTISGLASYLIDRWE